ncbi:hypothetical protein SAMN05421681_104133 [Lysobacter enzymogenes]|nr:hypothetical protein SAMN05421681_104133 [Lysobacter enzymogenes]
MEPWIPAFAGMTVGGGAAAWEIAARRDEALDPRVRGDDDRWGRGGVGDCGSMRHAQRDSETRARRA